MDRSGKTSFSLVQGIRQTWKVLRNQQNRRPYKVSDDLGSTEAWTQMDNGFMRGVAWKEKTGKARHVP